MKHFEQDLKLAIAGKLGREELAKLLDELHTFEENGGELPKKVDDLWWKLSEKMLRNVSRN